MFRRLLHSAMAFLALGSAMNVAAADAQESVDTLSVIFDFRVSRIEIDPNFGNNRQVAEDLHAALDSIGGDARIEVLGLHLDGTASPEGSHKFNMYLSRNRLDACEKLIEQWITVPDSLVSRNIGYIAWGQLRDSLVNARDLYYRYDALDIIDQPHELEIVNGQEVDTRVGKLKRLGGGRPWKDMLARFFPNMRAARMTLVYRRKTPIQGEQVPPQMPRMEEVAGVADFQPKFHAAPELPLPEPKTPKNLYVKTNLVGWALADANLGVEYQWNPHWSVGLHAYYGAIDLPSYRLKFRTLTFQPELRYWINSHWSVGLHPTLAWWNYGMNGDYRRQDHNGSSPAWGGGLAIAYHKQLSRHWFFEASAGGGVYRLHYDKYENYKNGPLVGEVRTTKLLVDQVSLSFVYRFFLK